MDLEVFPLISLQTGRTQAHVYRLHIHIIRLQHKTPGLSVRSRRGRKVESLYGNQVAVGPPGWLRRPGEEMTSQSDGVRGHTRWLIAASRNWCEYWQEMTGTSCFGLGFFSERKKRWAAMHFHFVLVCGRVNVCMCTHVGGHTVYTRRHVWKCEWV